ncbi:MAG: heparin lyase I family protein, partial [Verrucomicrobiales bacterium]
MLTVFLPFVLTAQETRPSPPAGYEQLYATIFNDGLDPDINRQAPAKDSLSLVDAPGGKPGKCLRVTMQQTDDFSAVANGSPRSELSFGKQFRIEPGKDYLIEWSTFLPLDHHFDEQQPESITQIHQSLSRGSPPFMLILTGDEYQVEIR